MKVLVADDSKAMRMIVTRAIRKLNVANIEFIEAGSGAEAYTAVQDQSPDLVVSDWNMPEMTGLELLQKIRADGNSVRFGFVTSECGPEREEEARSAGACFIVKKPFTPDSFEEALGPVLAG